MHRMVSVVMFALILVVGASCVAEKEMPAQEIPVPTKLLTHVGEAIQLLNEMGREPVVLRGDDPQRIVVVTPKLNGLVMCSSYKGEAGDTSAHVSGSQIRKGFSTKIGGSDVWNGFGAEERLWYAPEGGDYGLFFDAHQPQTWPNYKVFEPFNAIEFKVVNQCPDGKSVTMVAPPFELTNWQGNKMDVKITREIEVLDECPYSMGLGGKVKHVGFESRTWAQNIGTEAWSRDTTPLALWTVGTYNGTNHTIVMMPIKEGPDSELGESVTKEYFRSHGEAPDQYYAVKDGCVLTKPNGKFQTKLEILRKRALGRMASINLENNTMVIIEFRMYPQLPYTASFFHPYEKKVDFNDGGALSNFMNKGTVGDPVNSPIYELEVVSPMMELAPQEAFCHISRTYRLEADEATLGKICEMFFNIDMATLKKFDKESM